MHWDFYASWSNWQPIIQKLAWGPKQNGSHFGNGIFLNENVWIPIQISLKFVPKGPINNIQALV